MNPIDHVDVFRIIEVFVYNHWICCNESAATSERLECSHRETRLVVVVDVKHGAEGSVTRTCLVGRKRPPDPREI
jgi:hypothetical protein